MTSETRNSIITSALLDRHGNPAVSLTATGHLVYVRSTGVARNARQRMNV